MYDETMSNGDMTNRTVAAKSVYSGGFNTIKGKPQNIKLNMEVAARRSVIEFPCHTPQASL